jgi:hypothetical protein
VAVAKKKYKIDKRCGTVIGNEEGLISILGNDMLIYYIDQNIEKKFSGIDFELGEVAWLYCIPSKNKILTVMKESEQNEPPEPEGFIELGE